MNIKQFAGLIIILIVASFLPVNAQQPLSTETNYKAIGQHVSYLVETGKPLSITQAKVELEQGKFKLNSSPVLSFGIGSSAIWLSFKVTNHHESLQFRRLVIENSWLDKADIYVFHKNNLVDKTQLGDSFVFSQRPVKHLFLVYEHKFEPGLTQIFIRAETPDPMVLPIFFGTQDESGQRDTFNAYSYGFLYGIIIALLLYNAILFLTIRQSRYFFYVIYLSLFLATNLSYTGHGYYYLWPEAVGWQHWLNPLLISGYATSGIIFAFSFLKTRQHFPVLFVKTLVLMAFIWAVELFTIFFEFQTAAVTIAISFVILFSLFTLFLALLHLFRQLTESLYFLIATIATLVGATTSAMTVWGIIPYTDISYRAVEIGTSIDVILLSIALAEQFRKVTAEKIVAEKLARLDPLSKLYNRRAFYELTKPLLDNAERYDKDLSLVMMDIDNFKSINDAYGHQTGDEVINLTARILRKMIRKCDIAARWGGEEFIILLPETDLTHARLFAERVRNKIQGQEVKTESETVKFTVSLGVSSKMSTEYSLEDLVKSADHRLYAAKSSGRNQVI